MCSIETETNFIFCVHTKEKTGYPIKLVITDNKNDEGLSQKVNIDYCPFCGFTEGVDTILT